MLVRPVPAFLGGLTKRVTDVVGLLHSTMAIYYAYIDRAPILLLGATGPMNEAKRRPRIDWIHTANVQGNAVRDFTKWDDQPTSVDGIPSSFARGYRVAMMEPQGPVYLCYDAQLQEDPLDRDIHQLPGEFLVVQPLAPFDRVHEMPFDRIARVEGDVVAALHLLAPRRRGELDGGNVRNRDDARPSGRQWRLGEGVAEGHQRDGENGESGPANGLHGCSWNDRLIRERW